MQIDPEHDLRHLRLLCERQQPLTRVDRVADARPDWGWVDGWLCHARSDYFRIGAYRSVDDEARFLISQREPALVMLIVAQVDGGEAALLSLRAEPGLIGGVSLTTTIQSTPSNFKREHGGKATPFIDVAYNPSTYGTVVHDSVQFDWGSWYVQKRKRFLVVRLNEAVEAPEGFVWVCRETLGALLQEDHLVTNDLRVAATLPPSRHDADSQCGEDPAEPPGMLLRTGIPEEDCRGARIGHFRTETTTREVRSWVQPLLVPRDVMRIILCRRKVGGRYVYALQQRSEAGLLGLMVWFPASVSGGNEAHEQTVSTSAEGGRFWRYRIDMVVRTLGGEDAAIIDSGDWLDSGQVNALIAAPSRTSLELRMAWSLVARDDPPGAR